MPPILSCRGLFLDSLPKDKVLCFSQAGSCLTIPSPNCLGQGTANHSKHGQSHQWSPDKCLLNDSGTERCFEAPVSPPSLKSTHFFHVSISPREDVLPWAGIPLWNSRTCPRTESSSATLISSADCSSQQGLHLWASLFIFTLPNFTKNPASRYSLNLPLLASI
jgi:hypothetical protein